MSFSANTESTCAAAFQARQRMAFDLSIIVKLEEAYSKELADRIFTVLNSVYIQSVNDLLREASYPPIPFNIKC